MSNLGVRVLAMALGVAAAGMSVAGAADNWKWGVATAMVILALFNAIVAAIVMARGGND